MQKIDWFNTKKHKPKNSALVLGFCGGVVREIEFNNGLWLTESFTYHESAVTHWAYLNKPRVKKPKKVGFKPGESAQLMNPGFEAFQSHVDGSIVSCPKKLREHNKRNNVTNSGDYTESYFKNKGVELKAKAESRTQEDSFDRKRILHDRLTKEGVK